MEFEWHCKRFNETWPSPMPTQLIVPHNGTNGGCFDVVGPGKLAVANWSFTVDTSYLEPLIEYNMLFWVEKGVITATDQVSLYVQQPLAPNITIRSAQSAVVSSFRI